MKKLVLFVAIVATVALSACKKEAAPAVEEVAPIETTVPEEAAPLEEAPVEAPAETPAETPAQ